MVTFLFLPFVWPLWSVFAIQLHVIFHTFVSLCLYKNVDNEIKPSLLKNCLVLVDMKNAIGCIRKKNVKWLLRQDICTQQ